MSDYSRLRDEAFYGDEGHVIMSSDVPDSVVLDAHEQARFEEWADSLSDPYDDGDEL